MERKISNRKRGVCHPKYMGDYITPRGIFKNLVEAAIANDTYDNYILRRCKRGVAGYGFLAGEVRQPKWYIDLLSSDKGLQGSMILAGRVTRGKERVMYLTPKGLFGDVATACVYNEGVSEFDLKKLCLMGKKGWKVVKYVPVSKNRKEDERC